MAKKYFLLLYRPTESNKQYAIIGSYGSAVKSVRLTLNVIQISQNLTTHICINQKKILWHHNSDTTIDGRQKDSSFVIQTN